MSPIPVNPVSRFDSFDGLTTLLFYFYFKQYRNFSVDFAPDFSGLYRLFLSNSLAGIKEESSLP